MTTEIVRQAQGKTNTKARVEFAPDAFPPSLFSIELTLDAIPAIVSIEIPEDACGFRLHPTTGNVRFAVDKKPQATVNSTANVITVSDLQHGNTAIEEFWEVRTFETNNPLRAKKLFLLGESGNEVLLVEFF